MLSATLRPITLFIKDANRTPFYELTKHVYNSIFLAYNTCRLRKELSYKKEKEKL